MSLLFRDFAPGDETSFRDLNEEWIRAFFVLEPKDEAILNNPGKYILDPGGAIFLAEFDGKTVGCCALLNLGNGSYEVGKMAVSPVARGQGIGRKLLEYVIERSRATGATRLFLETNRKLENAVHLYEAVGFTPVPEERLQASPYARSDLAMELFLV